MKDGGPAFPSEVINEVSSSGGRQDWKNYKGMTLRDYFAAKAMQGMIAYGNHGSLIERDGADSAYRVADKMLEARDR